MLGVFGSPTSVVVIAIQIALTIWLEGRVCDRLVVLNVNDRNKRVTSHMILKSQSEIALT